VLLCFGALVSACAGGGVTIPLAADPATDTWMEHARLGDYQPETEDWVEIEEAARHEGEVVVYSHSSRVIEVCRTFTERYGIVTHAHDIGGPEVFEKLTREHGAGVYAADVVMVGDPAVVKHELLRRGHLVTYVPRELEAVIEESDRKPLLYHHMGAKVLMYNSEAMPDGPGIDTLWDLTRPEWRRRLIMKDPLKAAENLNFMAELVHHADEMAALYEVEFGQPLVTAEENAGYEFLKRLLANDPILTSGDDETAKAVGEPGQSNPPLGLLGASKMRLNKDKGYRLAFVMGLRPAVGVTYPSIVALAARAPHPNAAKLMVRWMMGDQNGGLGYAPYYLEGDYPTRTDVPLPPGLTSRAELGVWPVSVDWLYDNALAVRDYWVVNGGTTSR
jgi:iron(III) transport system substrate-binding protein